MYFFWQCRYLHIPYELPKKASYSLNKYRHVINFIKCTYFDDICNHNKNKQIVNTCLCGSAKTPSVHLQTGTFSLFHDILKYTTIFILSLKKHEKTVKSVAKLGTDRKSQAAAGISMGLV